VAIEQELEERRKQVEKALARQVEISEILQRGLLPLESPQVARFDVGIRYVSATEEAVIGGDFYDIVTTDSGQTAFIVGDVCGKGIRVAAMAAMAKQAMRASCILAVGPAESLSLASQILTGQLGEDSFVSSVVAMIDIDGCLVTASRAGHPPPILVSGGVVQLLENGGLLLGVIDDPTYENSTRKLQPGDTLVLYTDGVLEARQGRELFGTERFLEILLRYASGGARSISDRIAEACTSFSGGRLRDDFTVMVIKRK
jgi:phosphoserine phosphatase RsbU/P